MNMGAALRPDL